MLLHDRFLLAGLAGALLLAATATWILLAGPSSPGASALDPLVGSAAAYASGAATPHPEAATIVVDVEGAVSEPGIRELPAGSRVADAITAAGGYGSDADLAASARQLNLASALADGDQVYVPHVGEAGAAAGGSPAPGGGSGLVNLNDATPDQLDALPGIGPVTVQKIVAARTERSFATLDELVERKVLTASQLARIRDQVTV